MLSIKLPGRRKNSVGCSDRNCFIADKSLESMACECGFEILQVPVGHSMIAECFLYSAVVVLKSKRLTGKFWASSRTLGLNKIALYLNARDLVRI
jgi:hypothetical protein